MFKPNSPLLNFPSNLDRRQAFFLDGMRHAFEISDYAFDRLTKSLSELAKLHSEGGRPSGYGKYYLDAWAFVDSVDRLLVLWKMQPNTDGIPDRWNPVGLRQELSAIRDVRNVMDHLAQRAEQVLSSGTAAMGELSWINVTSVDPPVMKSYLIRPGFLNSLNKLQLNIPKRELIVRNGSANLLLKAHTHTADLSLAYVRMADLAVYVEESARLSFSATQSGTVIGGDLIAACDLVFPKVGD
jgi:hypothetical protein